MDRIPLQVIVKKICQRTVTPLPKSKSYARKQHRNMYIL